MGDTLKHFLDYQLLPGSKIKLSGQNVLFIAYSGNSMNPTLREPELMEVLPYNGQTIRCGDVICFKCTEDTPTVVHRVVGLTWQGIRTRGDNNPKVDDLPLIEEQVIGRVRVAWRGSKRRTIQGGWQGWLQGQSLRILRFLNQKISRQLSPLYQWLCETGFFSHLLPECLRPRIIYFRVDDRESPFLFWGRIFIGRYVETQGWIVQHPFRLVVNEQILKNIPFDA